MKSLGISGTQTQAGGVVRQGRDTGLVSCRYLLPAARKWRQVNAPSLEVDSASLNIPLGHGTRSSCIDNEKSSGPLNGLCINRARSRL